MVIKILLSLQREFLFWQYGIFIQSDCCLNIKMLSYQYRNSHYKDKTVSWLSYLYNGNIHTWKHRLFIETGPGSIITWFNITWYYCRKHYNIEVVIQTMKLNNPYFTPKGKLQEYFGETDHVTTGTGGCLKKAYELLNLRALKFSPVNKMHIFQCMDKIFCVEFQREPLKFHTKYLTHTLKDTIFNIEILRALGFKSS